MNDRRDWPTRDFLSHRTAATPDRLAIVDTETGREWSYRRFDALADGLAATIRDRLPADTPRVATLVSTSVEFAVLFHASLRVGAQVVPLNTRLSKRELGARLDRVDPDLLVCERATEAAALATADCPVASLDSPDSSDVAALDVGADGTDRQITPADWDRDETAVIVFTSGTTDEPNGVRLTLGNLAASATGSAYRLGVSPEDRWLGCLPIYHMGGLAPVVRCPLSGTTLLVQGGFDATETAQALAEYGATGVSLVPTQLQRMLDQDWSPPGSLETVLLGGAPASRSLVERALDSGVPVAPTYGLTETASQVATATPQQAREHPESVGQPLVVTDVAVVDADGELVERGETGELVVSGPTVTPGYLDDEQTERAFSARGLHTRDVGYRNEDGSIWILGRADDTIVTGGENVHPREVETVLREYPAVDDVAVVGLADEEWGERIGALLVGEMSALGLADVESFARERLADYKVPKTIAVDSSLPRTPSGTVERDAVRERLAEE
jgi:O-succinylbenzoic acid--CoA ligase